MDILKSIIKQKLHTDYMLKEFELMNGDSYEIRRQILNELLDEIEDDEGYEDN